MARSLVDTNILIYSRDLNEPVKRARAIEVIDQLFGISNSSIANEDSLHAESNNGIDSRLSHTTSTQNKSCFAFISCING